MDNHIVSQTIIMVLSLIFIGFYAFVVCYQILNLSLVNDNVLHLFR